MLYLECKPDETLARALGVPSREIRHQRNKDEVLKSLAAQSRGRAMVDEDPGYAQPPYLARLSEVGDWSQLGLRALEHRARGNRVIILRPRLEEWLLRAAQEAGLNLSNPRYNLPGNPVRLHREINRDLRKLERLLADLIAADAPRIQQLRSLLTDG